MAAVAITTVLAWELDLVQRGVKVMVDVPQGLPPFTLPPVLPDLAAALAVPALLIAIIGFVESVSVSPTLAAKRRARIDPDQELIGLGAANLGAAFAGGIARSVVNFDAGAETPAAGAFTALRLALASVSLTPLLHLLPQATLAATIIVAVLSLVDLGILRRACAYSRADFAAVAVTILATLLLGVEVGVSAGVALSLLLHLLRSARPHIAEVGRAPGTEHVRNIHRHAVETNPSVLSVRIDESLTFYNARVLEDCILDRIAGSTVREVIFACSAINEIDFSALETLEEFDHQLREAGIRLHLSEVKGPVMDRLKGTRFLTDLSGQVFISQHEACRAMPESGTALWPLTAAEQQRSGCLATKGRPQRNREPRAQRLAPRVGPRSRDRHDAESFLDDPRQLGRPAALGGRGACHAPLDPIRH